MSIRGDGQCRCGLPVSPPPGCRCWRPDLGQDPGALVKTVTWYGAEPAERRFQRLPNHPEAPHLDTWLETPAAEMSWVEVTGAAVERIVSAPMRWGQVGVCPAGSHHAVVPAWCHAVSGEWHTPTRHDRRTTRTTRRPADDRRS